MARRSRRSNSGAGNTGSTLHVYDTPATSRVDITRQSPDLPIRGSHDPRFHDPRFRVLMYLAIALIVIWVAGVLLPNAVFGPSGVEHSLAWWVSVLETNFSRYASLVLGQPGSDAASMQIASYCMPPLAGAALGISGAVYQGSLKNALASPSTLGVMAGANLGVTVYALLFISNEFMVVTYNMSEAIEQMNAMTWWEYLLDTQSLALFAIAGSLIVAGIVLGVSLLAGRGRISGLALIITGQVLMALIGAVNQLIRYWLATTSPDSAQSLIMRTLQTSRLGNAFSWIDVAALGIPVIACIVVLVIIAPRLNALSLGEDEAIAMGINTNRLRLGSVILCTVLTAIIVAYVGTIGFIGFFIPHLMRRIVGPDLRFLLPASALGGAVFLTAAFFLIGMYDPTAVSGIGIITSIIGGIAFVIILMRQKGTGDGWI